MKIIFPFNSSSGIPLAITKLIEINITQPKEEKGGMSILQQVFTTDQKKDGCLSLINRAKSLAARLGESFWFCLTFLLFIVLGPFSVIAVLMGLWSLASSDECKSNMVEPASI